MGLQTVTAEVVEKRVFVPGELDAVRFLVPAQQRAAWLPGDFFYIEIPTESDPRPSRFKTNWPKPATRAYTISNWGSEYYETVVVLATDPYVSELLQQVNAGDQLQVSSPKWFRHGPLTMRPDDWQKKILLFGGGTGIAHALSCVRFLLHESNRGLDPDVWVIGSFRDRAWVLFYEEFCALAAQKKNFKFAFTLTRSKEAVPEFHSGRAVSILRDPETKAVIEVKRNIFSELIPDLSERWPWLCGTDQMKEDLFHVWGQAGIPRERIKFESWG